MNKPLQRDNKAVAALADPLIGLIVTLPDRCKCGTHEAIVGPGAGPHLASLRCGACEAHRGWMSATSHAFLTETIKQFGRPEAPIVIKRSKSGGVGFINIGKLDSSREETTDDRQPPIDTASK